MKILALALIVWFASIAALCAIANVTMIGLLIAKVF